MSTASPTGPKFAGKVALVTGAARGVGEATGALPHAHGAQVVALDLRLPFVLTRVELERAEIAVTVEEFLTAAKTYDADVEVIDVPLGHHGFETIDHTEPARDAVERAMRSVLERLRR